MNGNAWKPHIVDIFANQLHVNNEDCVDLTIKKTNRKYTERGDDSEKPQNC